jgi:LPXTG-motif cell wall-anchored protein
VPATVLNSQATPAPSVQSFSQGLPETGRPTVPLLALATGAVLGGIGLVTAARRRPEQA